MIDFCVQRKGTALFAVSSSDEREIARLPQARVISIQTHPAAPLKLSRWYRAGVQLLVEATGRWPNREVAHRELMIQAGFFESFVISAAGDVRFSPQSTADWGLVEWREFMQRVEPIMLGFAGETSAKWRGRVDSFFGIKFREAWEG